MKAELALRELGTGPTVVLVHGGMGPEITWERQELLAERWRLVIPKRRDFPGSAPAVRQDFEHDSYDLSPLLGDGAHLVGFSYGGVGAALLAQREPARNSIAHPGRVADLRGCGPTPAGAADRAGG
jgi:pimeloyl-ACP methyl ester carboxylesterase